MVEFKCEHSYARGEKAAVCDAVRLWDYEFSSSFIHPFHLSALSPTLCSFFFPPSLVPGCLLHYLREHPELKREPAIVHMMTVHVSKKERKRERDRERQREEENMRREFLLRSVRRIA